MAPYAVHGYSREGSRGAALKPAQSLGRTAEEGFLPLVTPTPPLTDWTCPYAAWCAKGDAGIAWSWQRRAEAIKHVVKFHEPLLEIETVRRKGATNPQFANCSETKAFHSWLGSAALEVEMRAKLAQAERVAGFNKLPSAGEPGESCWMYRIDSETLVEGSLARKIIALRNDAGENAFWDFVRAFDCVVIRSLDKWAENAGDASFAKFLLSGAEFNLSQVFSSEQAVEWGLGNFGLDAQALGEVEEVDEVETENVFETLLAVYDGQLKDNITLFQFLV